MLMNLSSAKKEDICPNCGTACFATDVLCPNCGKNLDELFEQLPDLEGSHNIFSMAARHLAFFNWLVPVLIILSPILVSFLTVLPFALRVQRTLDRGPLQLIAFVVPSFSLLVSVFLVSLSAVPLYLCTKPLIRVKLKRRLVLIITMSFSIFSVITLWSALAIVNIMSSIDSFAYFGGLVQIYTPSDWVYFVIITGIILIALNLMVVVGQEKTA